MADGPRGREGPRLERWAQEGGRGAGHGGGLGAVCVEGLRVFFVGGGADVAAFFEERAAEGGAFEDRLDEVVLFQGLGKVFVHLGLDALFAVAKHCVSCEGDDGCSLCP